LSSPVAILIVNYRVYDDLERVLPALAALRRPGDEIAVFDQVSDRARLEPLREAYPWVRWLPSAENIGFAAGVNRAAAATQAPYLLLLNPDTVIDGPIVDDLAGWLDAQPTTGLVGPRVVNEDDSVQASARRFPGPSTVIAGRSTWLSQRFPDNWLTRRNLVARSAAEPVSVDWLAGSCVMTRRDLFERLGGLDEGFFMYWEDADYARRARELGYRSVYLPTVRVRHLGGRSAAQDPGPAIRAFHRSAYRMYWKHAGAAGRLAAPLVKVYLWVRGEVRARRA
jgi:GT2 family glycosyltransferase